MPIKTNEQKVIHSFIEKLAKQNNDKYSKELSCYWIKTSLGSVLSISDDKFLYLLAFAERKKLLKVLERLQKQAKAKLIFAKTKISRQIELELKEYFASKLKRFKTPIKLIGTDFQKLVWQNLRKIPYGKTCSYADLAESIANPSAVRAVANSNANNCLSLIVPCHRVIGSNGKLTGYAGGLERKEALIELEASCS